jgi:hypothetical protein
LYSCAIDAHQYSIEDETEFDVASTRGASILSPTVPRASSCLLICASSVLDHQLKCRCTRCRRRRRRRRVTITPSAARPRRHRSTRTSARSRTHPRRSSITSYKSYRRRQYRRQVSVIEARVAAAASDALWGRGRAHRCSLECMHVYVLSIVQAHSSPCSGISAMRRISCTHYHAA